MEMIWVEFDELNSLNLSKHGFVAFLHVIIVSCDMGSVSSHVNVFIFKIIKS